MGWARPGPFFAGNLTPLCQPPGGGINMAAKTAKKPEKPEYVKPEMKTVVTPGESRDIDQPCAFSFHDNNCT
jgi:hypothetical protein